ncbi:MAG: VWA domain-containing protein [Lachnospiraceae bacterium]|nr:VWA domain-containing protein [Lachnospiraceae bacterium]
MKTTDFRRMVTSALAAAMVIPVLTGCGSIKAEYTPAKTGTVNYATEEAPAAATEEVYFGCYASDEEPYYEEEPSMYDESGYDAVYEAAVAEESAYDSFYDNGYTAYSADAESFSLSGRESMKQGGTYIDGLYDSYRGYDKHNNETYDEIDEQGYKSVKNHPLSTFAADVDTASYSNLRRMLNSGYRLRDIPEGSVRIEEMINYFDYDYKGPKGMEPFGVNAEISECPWNEDAMLMSIGLKTQDIDFSETPDSNLVFLIDVSGSMNSEDKLPLLQESFFMLTDELSDKDRVSIVTYASGVETVLKGARGNESRKIKNAVMNLYASGATNGGEGILTAYDIAEKYFIKGGNNRIVLATDGDLNLGITSVDELNKLVSHKKESGVYLSVLGFGTGNINDSIMQTLADNGNGNYSYIDSLNEAKKVLVDELSANMLTVCKDVKLQAEFNPETVKGYRLLGYTNRVMKDKDFDNDRKDGGEIGAGHEVTALYEIIPANGHKMSKNGGEEIMTLNIRFKRPSEDESSLLTYPITLEAYNRVPTDEFLFKSAVAEFGLLASDSLFSEDADIDNVVERLEKLDLDDDSKVEFYKLIAGLS